LISSGNNNISHESSDIIIIIIHVGVCDTAVSTNHCKLQKLSTTGTEAAFAGGHKDQSKVVGYVPSVGGWLWVN
jgi:hypothetical protein